MSLDKTFCVTLMIALVASWASGQGVDARVQWGDALDANPGVGSRGYNSGIGVAQIGQAINSQLYVNGRVSGLAGFRGRTPYSAVGALQLSLPGGSVRNFRQQSVGLQEITAGGATYRASPYLDRAQTVLGLRGIMSGLASPGSNVPQHSTLPRQVANELYSTAVRRYQPIMRNASSAGLVLWQSSVQGPLGMPVVAGQIAAPGRFEGVTRPGAGAIFALPWQENREELLAELNAIRKDRGATAQLNPQDDQIEDDPRINTMITGQPDVETDSAVLPTGAMQTLMPEPGQDAFHDLLMEMRAQQAADADPADDRRLEDADRQRQARSLVVPEESGALIIRSLAGRNQDMFNRFMVEAESLMDRGRYYDAAVKFSSASSSNLQNPFSHMGAALAMFAAGEPVSSAVRLRRAMTIFPPIMETQLAVADMMDADVFRRRLADLDRLLGGSSEDNQMLLMLATYMNASVDNDTEAAAFAQRLADVADDPMLAAYAKFVLTGERPDE